jgi:hypothetical protein
MNAITAYDGVTVATGSLKTGASGMAINSGTTMTRLLFGATTFTCPSSGSVASGSSGSTTITIANLNSGDFVIATTGSLPIGYFLRGASATSASILTLYLYNTAASDVAESECDVRYFVLS